jgi:hypothetical protein
MLTSLQMKFVIPTIAAMAAVVSALEVDYYRFAVNCPVTVNRNVDVDSSGTGATCHSLDLASTSVRFGGNDGDQMPESCTFVGVRNMQSGSDGIR